MSRERLLRKFAAVAPETATYPALRMSDVQAERVSWLWAPFIPLGKITILEGDPSVGKSWITARIARDVSRGEVPGSAGRPEFVLMLTAEDGLSDTLRPRLDAMGADCNRIRAIEQAIDLSTPGALEMLRATIAEHRPALVTIDPIVAYVGGRLDLHRANEVRAILAPLARIAEDCGAAILIVRHLSKARAGRALHAGLGSIDFTAAARSVLLAGSAVDEPDRRAIVQTKSNLARLGRSLAYRIGEDGLEWLGTSDLRAADLLGAESSPEEASEKDTAAEFVAHFLAHGARSAADVVQAGLKEGISVRTLQRATKRIGVQKRREGFGCGSVWQLPPSPDSEVVANPDGGTNAPRTGSRSNENSNRAIRAEDSVTVGPLPKVGTNGSPPEPGNCAVCATDAGAGQGTNGGATADEVRV